jgi:starch synthase
VYVVMVASECAPVAQAGGLGEVVFGLSRELELRGHQVEILLPKYDCMRYDRIEDLHIIWFDLWVPWGGGGIHTTVWAGWVYGRRCLFLEPHSSEGFFNRGHYYGSPDDVSRFAFFCKAALEFLLRSGRRPDVLHCHDWQTGLVPVLLYEMYQHAGMATQRVCYTIHNFSHQGLAGEYILAATGLSRPQHYFDYERLRDNFNPFAINLMKGGIVYSNFVTTVSPQHAWEVMSTEQGMGLGETLHRHSVKFTGVLNGVDYEVWNTQTDPHVPVPYDVHDVSGKYAAKRALRDRCLMAHPFKPVVAYVGRLDRQKGVHLIEHAIFYALAQGAQFILLGSAPDPAVAGHFRNLKNRLNDNPDCHLELEFNQELAHQIYAGADLIVVPSLFEPCGLTQLIALRYGTVPVVRAIGGLVDTVFDRDYSDRPPEQRNGYVFHQVDGPALESAMDRAIGLWYVFPEMFCQLMANGMRSDNSWAGPGQAYLDIYEHIRHR